MKSKIIFFCLSIILVFSLSACGQYENPIESISFNVTFDELNLEDNTAIFTVYGYPNEREFEQISTVIVNSLDAQKVKDPINVSVYSSFEESTNTEEPFFGTAIYKDGKLSENKLKQNSEENYLNFI